MDKHADVIIIGAGIAGLMVASILKKEGIKTLLLDKGRSIGGRIATRRSDPYRFDHGAQTINLADPIFKDLLAEWKNKNLLTEQTYSILDPQKKSDSFGGVNGISTLTKEMALGLDVKTKTRVVSIDRKLSKWQLKDEQGKIYTCDFLLITTPAPQALELFDNSPFSLPEYIRTELTKIKYHPSIALMAVFDSTGIMIEETIKSINNQHISLIIDNYAKSVSKQPGAITIITSLQFARTYFQNNDEQIISIIMEQLKAFLPGNPTEIFVHRWRYSTVSERYPNDYLMDNQNLKLAFAGDGFSDRAAEGAALSGAAVAKNIIKNILCLE